MKITTLQPKYLLLLLVLFTFSCKKNKPKKGTKSKVTQETPEDKPRIKEEILKSLKENAKKMHNDVNDLQNAGQIPDDDTKKGEEFILNIFGIGKYKLNSGSKEKKNIDVFEEAFSQAKDNLKKEVPKYSNFKEYLAAFKKNFEAIQKDVKEYIDYQDLIGNEHYKNMITQIATLSKLLNGEECTVKNIKDVICGDYTVSPNIKSLHSNTTDFKKEVDKL